ncbi:hypothetical protein FAVG1_10214 [Fusarium avenaceum]|nr:hypothetical protein FAVG1_10214 [Fusarium avenaceum]
MSKTPVPLRPMKAAGVHMDNPFVLTPVRQRRTRPSFSPVKTPRQTSHKTSSSFSSGQNKPVPTSPSVSIATAALEFEGFSFWDDEGFMGASHLTSSQQQSLHKHLLETFNATEILESFPFLIIGCKGGPPDEDKRPFSVAGAIAIWRDAEDFNFMPIVGDLGYGDPIEVEDHILDQIVDLQVPSDNIILHLANLWPDCEAVCVLWTMFVVELPLVSKEKHYERLHNLPCSIDACPLMLRFHNGPLPNTERKITREVKPNPKTYGKEICDETDYVKLRNKFYPGTMIGSADKHGSLYSMVTAGILVEKDGERRLTCSYHCWEDHCKKYPERFGKADTEAMNTFKVLQGNPGSAVGFVRERLGETDIALAQLHDGIVFENEFMETEMAPKKFLKSVDHNIGDLFTFDSFAVGKQTVSCLGRRFTIGWKGSGPHPHLVQSGGGPVDRVMYIAFQQGAFVTNSPEITGKPQIRDRVCGSVLLRCSDKSRGNKRRLTQKTTMEEGEIGGMLHLADLQFKNSDQIDNYILYADSFDPLIDAGWNVVHETTKYEEVVEEDSPTKKQRTGSN